MQSEYSFGPLSAGSSRRYPPLTITFNCDVVGNVALSADIVSGFKIDNNKLAMSTDKGKESGAIVKFQESGKSYIPLNGERFCSNSINNNFVIMGGRTECVLIPEVGIDFLAEGGNLKAAIRFNVEYY
ncbi:hypothetical protein HMPREF1564_3849 [Providencia alcalifaciens R90-1475]|nr:hypothetical protein HMPREF1564_3849 [Providencia alcalifaciens R90-1475]